MLNTFKAYDDPNGARFRQIMLSAWKGMKYKIGDSYQGMAGYPSYEVTVDMVDIDAIIMSVGSFASIDEAVNYAASDKAPRRTRTMNTQTYLDDEKNWKLTFSGIDQLIGLTPY